MRSASLFAIACYAIFFATFLYLIGFVGDFGLVPRTVDTPASSVGTGAAIVIDLALIALFGLQHSVMARQGFKRAWTKIVPRQCRAKRLCAAASVALMVMFLFWQPVEAAIWTVTAPAGSLPPCG